MADSFEGTVPQTAMELERVLQLYQESTEGALSNQEFNVLSSRSKTREEKVLSSVR